MTLGLVLLVICATVAVAAASVFALLGAVRRTEQRQARALASLQEELRVERQRHAAEQSCERAHERTELVEATVANVLAVAKDSLGSHTALSSQALHATTAQAEAALASRQEMIDGHLHTMHQQLESVSSLVVALETDRAEKFGQLSRQLADTARSTASLNDTAQGLREALANPKVRGQWGERVADDVLRAAGFVEGVSYRAQKAIPGVGTIPDFTFLLPKERVLHMDAKFPASNYLRYLEADDDDQRARFAATFVKDVRNRVKELRDRGYVDPERNTVDCVLLFIPNESVFGFINEHDPGLVDLALREKVVICSPFTLFSVLAVIRQAVDSFTMEQTSDEVVQLLAAFGQQYEKFCDQQGKVLERFAKTHTEFETLVTTRRRMLERPLAKIDQLRQQKGLPIAGGFDLPLLADNDAADVEVGRSLQPLPKPDQTG